MHQSRGLRNIPCQVMFCCTKCCGFVPFTRAIDSLMMCVGWMMHWFTLRGFITGCLESICPGVDQVPNLSIGPERLAKSRGDGCLTWSSDPQVQHFSLEELWRTLILNHLHYVVPLFPHSSSTKNLQDSSTFFFESQNPWKHRLATSLHHLAQTHLNFFRDGEFERMQIPWFFKTSMNCFGCRLLPSLLIRTRGEKRMQKWFPHLNERETKID